MYKIVLLRCGESARDKGYRGCRSAGGLGRGLAEAMAARQGTV